MSVYTATIYGLNASSVYIMTFSCEYSIFKTKPKLAYGQYQV